MAEGSRREYINLRSKKGQGLRLLCRLSFNIFQNKSKGFTVIHVKMAELV